MVRAALIILFFSELLMLANAETIYIHTENKNDLIALQNQNYSLNLSTSTNLHALKNTSHDIQYEYMTTKRSLSFMENNRNICVVNKIKTEDREAKYIFSKPINLFLGRRLYQNTQYEPLPEDISKNNIVDVKELFNYRPNSQLIVSGQISYGNYLDSVLKTYAHENLMIRQSSEHDSAIINMIDKGRMEFALLFPQQVYAAGYGLNTRSYEIAEIPPFVVGHIMCTRNTNTEAFISETDNNLEEQQSKERLLNIHLGFINPSDNQVFKNYFRQVF